MSKLTITIVDTTGIQDYVFSSNRLSENIGASYLVSQATKEWIEKALQDLRNELKHRKEVKYKIHIPNIDSLHEVHISNEDIAAEIIYTGGGNAVLLFASFQYAKKFTKILSKRVLQDAPGLNIVVAHHQDFEFGKGDLKEKINYILEQELAKKKRERIASVPLLGLGVTATCQSTQLPAVDTSKKYINTDEEDIYLISRETKAKLKAVPHANHRLIKEFQEIVNSQIYEFPNRTDYLGRSEGDSSYVAIVHADGNGMGNRFQKCGQGKSDEETIIDMRQLSYDVQNAGMAALKKVVAIIYNSIENGEIIGKIGKFLLKKSKEGKYYLPFRPLVFGGDDVIFVCDGRLGLELAEIYLREFENQKVSDNEKLTARAGVCIVKTHYPFARAYTVVEELYKEAKNFIREERQRLNESEGYYCSSLDWHFATSGLIGSIGDIRQREYQVPAGNLIMRPILIKDHDTDDEQWRTWFNFINIVQHFNGLFDDVDGNEPWKDRHNKVIALREVLRDGANKTKQFMNAYGIKILPLLGGVDDLQNSGWFDNRCGYFDAIEALDFYIDLKGNQYE